MFNTQLILLPLLFSISPTKTQDCNLSEDLVKEIQSYQTIVDQIINATTNGQFKGETYNELAVFVDKFGSRLSGSQNLEDSIDYLLELMPSYGVENVHGEDVQVPHWVRESETATLVLPREAKISLLALGGSISTPEDGIEAQVVVVRSMDDLHQNYSDSVDGKIVVYNYDYAGYGSARSYRSQGAIQAATYGAVAALVRSATDFSMDLPHTGATSYSDDVTQIPTAAITVEHANMLQRMQDRGDNITIRLNIQTESLPESTSRNTVGEVEGSENPEKVVIVSGHLDSWDVGVGAMDDGGGVFISWYSLVVLKALGLRPKRTVRAVLWTNEENGMAGVRTYNSVHQEELDNFIFIMESDYGTFTPLGLEFVAGQKGTCILTEIMKLLAPINATQAVKSSSVGSDIALWTGIVPTGSLLNANEDYFWYHHTKADTMDIMDTEALDKATALWASVAYVLADLTEDFPRDFSDSGFHGTPNILCVAILSLVGFFLY